MKTEKNIFIAFILNLFFSLFEFFGGIFTGSIAIMSDAIHDIGDAASIGVSFFLEKKAKKQPDSKYTYGYLRYSVIGGFITSLILLLGSVTVIYNAINKFLNPTEINYNGMIIFAIIGVIVNFTAALLTREGDSINQRAVNLHMLEDVLGWLIVLIGAVLMKFTDMRFIDPLLSIGVAVFVLINAFKNLKEIADLFLEKIPHGIDSEEIVSHLLEIDGVIGVHHIHIWSMDGQSNYATMHIVTNGDSEKIKEKVREELSEHNICHVTLELENENEHCECEHCHTDISHSHSHHHHHHH